MKSAVVKKVLEVANAKAAAEARIARDVAAMFERRSARRWLWVEKWGRDGYAYKA